MEKQWMETWMEKENRGVENKVEEKKVMVKVGYKNDQETKISKKWYIIY